MATALENRTQESIGVAQREAELHNQRIKERYERLMSTEEDQLNESFSESKAFSSARASSVLSPERPAEAEKTYTRTRVDSPLFTTETLERTLAESKAEQASAPVVQEVAIAPVSVVSTKTNVAAYSVSAFAKAVIAGFAVLVCVMLCIIGINSETIRRKNVKIRRLEDKRQELEEESEDILSRIEEVRSFEFIKTWAEANGFVFE